MQKHGSTSTRPPAKAERSDRVDGPTPRKHGRGFIAGFLTFFAAAVAAFACLVLSSTGAGRARSAAVFIAALGGLFVFGFVYEAVQGFGVGVSASVGAR